MAEIANKSIGGILDALGGGDPVSLTAPVLGTPASGDLSNCDAATTSAAGVVELATDAEAKTGTSDAVVMTPGNTTARLAEPGPIGGTTPGAIAATTISSSAGIVIDYVGVSDANRTNTALSTDHVVIFTSLTADRTYQISSEDIAQAGRVIVIKDGSGKAATFNIIISTEGAETIDGAATFTLSSNYGAINLVSNGSNLFVY